MSVEATPVIQNTKRFSAPVRWFASAIREAGPWFAFFGTVAAIIGIVAKHAASMCEEAQSWCAKNIDTDNRVGGSGGAAGGKAAPSTTSNSDTNTSEAA